MSTTTREIDDYVTAVHAALADLPDDEREDLLDDLPQHLADVQADHAGSLAELIGTPEAYAAELRATAGLDATPAGRPWWQSTRERVATADAWLGSVLNYDRFVDLLRALAPGWWLVRAYLLVQVCTHAVNRFGSHALVPQVGNSRVAGVALLAVACAGSVWLGRRGFTHEWQRVVSVLLGFALLWFGVVLVHRIEGSATVYSDSGYTDDGTSNVTNVFPVGPDGSVITNVRLYDQDGNPIQLGSTCPDFTYHGEPTDGPAPASAVATSAASADGAAVYPLTCDSGQGPHAPALPSASLSPSTAPSTSAAPTSSTPATPTESGSR